MLEQDNTLPRNYYVKIWNLRMQSNECYHLLVYGLICMVRNHLSVHESSVYLFSRGRREVLISLQEALTESSLIRGLLHSRKGHLTLQEVIYELEA